MKIWKEPAEFDWDEGNREKNWIRHEVKLEEAEDVFSNQPQFLFRDEIHSESEIRYGVLGTTNEGRKLSIVFTIRNRKIRVITARDMSKKERSDYEKIQKNSKI